MKLEDVRKLALSLPDTTEEPHHNYGSFRVKGRIYATFPPEQTHLHLFVDETAREAAVAMDPGFVEKLWWGSKVVGLRIELAAARRSTVVALVRQAYEHKRAAGPARPTRRR